MESYQVQRPPSGWRVSILFPNHVADVVPYHFGEAFLIDIEQLKEQLTRNPNWWLPVSSVTSLLGGQNVYSNPNLTLRICNGPFGIRLSGCADDFYKLAKELNRAFPCLEKLVTKLRVPPNTDLSPFFSSLRARELRCNIVDFFPGPSKNLVSLLESTVLNQNTSIMDIDNKLTSLELSQLRLFGQPGTPIQHNQSLLVLTLELELNQHDAAGAAKKLANWLFRFQSLKCIQISGDCEGACFVTPFLQALKDGNQKGNNGPGLSASCLVIEFLDVYGEMDTPDNKEQCIGQECQEMVLECIRDWKDGFLWIGLGSQANWNNESPFRKQLQYEATLKWLTEAPHFGASAISLSHLGPEISMEDVCNLLESGQHLFPPPNFPELFPGMIASEIPIDIDCLSNANFKFQMFFNLLMRNPSMVAGGAMVVGKEEGSIIAATERKAKRSRRD